MPTIIYVASGRDDEITVFALNDDGGQLETQQRIPLPGTVTPLTISSDGRFLYAGLRAPQPAAAAFAIDPRSGQLTLLGYAPLRDAPMYCSTDAQGKFLLSASYAAGSFTISPIGADGSIGATPIQHTATPPRAHAILVDPSNRFVFVTALGGDMILQYVFDAATGRAQPSAVPFVATPSGSGPRHLAFHPHRSTLYVNGELDGTLYSFALHAVDGHLRAADAVPLLPAADQPSWAAEIAVTPDGRLLFASERQTSTISIFDVSAESGTLVRRDVISTEAQPRALAIDPRGRWLIVAGEKSDHLSVYRIDATTGTLIPRHRYAVGAKPVWISILNRNRGIECDT